MSIHTISNAGPQGGCIGEGEESQYGWPGRLLNSAPKESRGGQHLVALLALSLRILSTCAT